MSPPNAHADENKIPTDLPEVSGLGVALIAVVVLALFGGKTAGETAKSS